MPTAAKEITVSGKVKIGGSNPLFLIGGPCVIESHGHALFMAQEIKKVCEELEISFIFKASFDKANRSSISSYRGPGLEAGLKTLSSIQQKLGVPVLSDVHETSQVEEAAQILDIIQIPAFLCRQTDLIVEAARTHKPLNIKKGQFLSPYDMKYVIEKVLNQENDQLLLTERGSSFGYNNLVFDIRSIPIMKQWGFPVIIDASHSVQRPGGEGSSSGGNAEFIQEMAKAGISVGADGIFLEIHDNPARALSDKHNSLNLNKLKVMLQTLLRIKKAIDMKNSDL